MKKLTVFAAAVWMSSGAYAAGFDQQLSINAKGLKAAVSESAAAVTVVAPEQDTTSASASASFNRGHSDAQVCKVDREVQAESLLKFHVNSGIKPGETPKGSRVDISSVKHFNKPNPADPKHPLDVYEYTGYSGQQGATYKIRLSFYMDPLFCELLGQEVLLTRFGNSILPDR